MLKQKTIYIMKELFEQLKKDPELYQAYQANIAMAFVDATNQNPDKTVHEIANIAATTFLDLLIK